MPGLARIAASHGSTAIAILDPVRLLLGFARDQANAPRAGDRGDARRVPVPVAAHVHRHAVPTAHL